MKYSDIVKALSTSIPKLSVTTENAIWMFDSEVLFRKVVAHCKVKPIEKGHRFGSWDVQQLQDAWAQYRSHKEEEEKRGCHSST